MSYKILFIYYPSFKKYFTIISTYILSLIKKKKKVPMSYHCNEQLPQQYYPIYGLGENAENNGYWKSMATIGKYPVMLH